MKNKKGNSAILDILNKNELSIEELRKYPGFEDVSEEEGKEHIKLIKTFDRVLFDIYKNDKKIN